MWGQDGTPCRHQAMTVGCRTEDGRFRDGRPIDYRAATYALTQVNLTNHSCPNLAGEAAGPSRTPAPAARRPLHPTDATNIRPSIQTA